MASVDLVFAAAPLVSPHVALVFNDAPGEQSAPMWLAAQLPRLQMASVLSGGDLVECDFAAALPGPGLQGQVQYVSLAHRPTVGRTHSAWQVAQANVQTGQQARHQRTQALEPGVHSAWQAGARVRSSGANGWGDTLRLRTPRRVPMQRAVPTTLWPLAARHQDSVRIKLARSTRHQDGVHRRMIWRDGWQERYRDRRPQLASRWQPAAPLRRVWRARATEAQYLRTGRSARHQEAMRPPAGMWVRPPRPVQPPSGCYVPSGHLMFRSALVGGGLLVFVCDGQLPPPLPPATVVVPVQRVYIVINNVLLRRVDGDIALPALDLRLALDVDSWSWDFAATLPASALPHLEPGIDGLPVELEASINGQAVRLLAETLARERVFGGLAVRVGGRGKAALLAAPYAPAMSFGNSAARTAQQLMGDVLSVNGVPLGWDVDWGLTDWQVPAGALSVQGSYIDALVAIAGAAGGYLQPHPTEEIILVRPRYPAGPWEWSALTPDVQLPADVAVREAVEWLSRPAYNRVYVSGTTQGVLGQVTRNGTAGDVAAPMVTDALITDIDAVRQRGLAVLSDTGRQARVTLRTPVLPGAGIIVPGALVRYVDGLDTRLGLVRATTVEAGCPEVWQSIQLETHLDP